MPAAGPPEIERVFREEYGRAVAVLTRYFGDIDIAEEAVAEVEWNCLFAPQGFYARHDVHAGDSE